MLNVDNQPPTNSICILFFIIHNARLYSLKINWCEGEIGYKLSTIHRKYESIMNQYRESIQMKQRIEVK